MTYLILNTATIDYLTLTTFDHHADFHRVFEATLPHATTREARLTGYDGWLKKSEHGSLFFGAREYPRGTNALLNATGMVAKGVNAMLSATNMVADEPQFRRLDANCTRIDLQITITMSAEYRRELLYALYEELAGRHRVIYDTDSITVYFYSTKSRKRARVYEKPDVDAIRLEFQLRDDYANRTFKSLQQSTPSQLLLYYLRAAKLKSLDIFDKVLATQPARPVTVEQSSSTKKWLLESVLKTLANNLHDPDVFAAFSELIERQSGYAERDALHSKLNELLDS